MKQLIAAALLAGGLSIGFAVAQDAPKGKGKGKGPVDPAKRAEMILKQFDKDGDGFLSKEEFAATPLAARVKEKGGDVDKFFAARDTDKDGKLSKEELAAPPAGGKGKGKGKGKKD